MAMRERGGFEDGFNWKTVVGAFFVGLVMMPASIYISLFSGAGMGPAAQWVTIILFAELARRSISTLKKQEMYVLYHVAAALTGGGIFSGLIWNQYMRQSREAAAFGVAQGMPNWAAPAADSAAVLTRHLWDAQWLPAIGLVLVGAVLYRLNMFGLGYALFRVTSDVERLPFPMAPVAAEGATALAESPDRKVSWRWRVFSVGTMLGAGFGILYIGIPAVTGLVLAKPLFLFPIPWVDFTGSVESILPAATVNISFDAGSIIWGMVLPFWMVIGQFAMCILTAVVANPILQHLGLLPTWKRGMGIISTMVANGFDFWMSIWIGAALSVAVIGIWQLIKVFRKKKAGEMTENEMLTGKRSAAAREQGAKKPPKGRGDFPIWVAVVLFFVSTTGYVWLCHYLVPKFPLLLLIFFGFIWTPLTSYISARMIGLTGNGVGFPFVREGSFMLSGYKGVDVWFAPIPLNDYGWVAAWLKQTELTKTSFISIIKAELLLLPINAIFSFAYWAFFWFLSAIPSYLYPFAQKMWPFNAINSSLFMTATMEGRSWLLEALKPAWMSVGFAGGLGLYGLIGFLKWPLFVFYGAMTGIASTPDGPLLMITGALLSRFYFEKRFGEERWRKWTPVLGAGFAAGVGLIGMLAVGLIMVTGSVVTKSF